MTTFLLSLLIFIALAYYLTRVKKRVIVKPVAKNGLIGPELLAEKTRLDALKEWARPMAWGVAVGLVVCPVCGWWVGWWR